MFPTRFRTAPGLLPDVQFSIYPDSGQGGIFQHSDLFVAQALAFLRD